jgi:type IV pilus assembly protein PilM
MAAITAVEFTDTCCRLAQGEAGKGRPVLRELFTVEMPAVEDAAARLDRRAQALREALRAHGIKGGEVRLIIPKNAVMARMVTLPSSDDGEVAGMARFEAERHIPFNAERHVVSHHILARHGVQGSQVLLAAVDEPVATEHIDVCSRAGLTVGTLGVSSLSMFNGFAAAHGPHLADKVVAMVNIGAACTDLAIASNGLLNFTRGCSVGVDKLLADLREAEPGRQLTARDLASMDSLEPHRFFPLGGPAAPSPAPAPAPDGDSLTAAAAIPADAARPDNRGAVVLKNWLLRLLQEIRRTYEYARREFNCPPIQEIYICGEGAAIGNLPEFFRANFAVEAHVYDPLRDLELSPKIRQAEVEPGPAYAALAGEFVHDAPRSVRVNLLPPAYVHRRSARRQKQSWITTGVLALGLLVLAYLFISDRFAQQRETLEFLRGRNAEMKQQVAELESKRTRLDIMERFIKDSHGALKVMDKISGFDFIPSSVTITRFEYKKDEEIKIQGHAKSFPDTNRMRSELERTGFFESVSFDEGSGKSRVLPSRSEPIFEYFITCRFAKRAPSKGGKAARPAAAATTPAAAARKPAPAAQEEAADGVK